MSTDDSCFLGNVNAADRVAVGLFSGISGPGRCIHWFFSRGQRDDNAVANIYQQSHNQ